VLFLYRAYELRSFRAIVREQARTGAVYGSATYARFFPYKLELARTRATPVLVLGSSTMMTVREQAFTAPMTNAAGGLRHISEGQLFMRELLATYRPRVLLLGADFWWFHPADADPPSYDENREDADALTLFKVLDPLVRLRQGTLTWHDLVRVVRGDRSNRFTTFDHLGWLAIGAGIGFRPDGSILLANLFAGQRDAGHTDLGFAQTLGEVERGEDKFRHGRHLDAGKVMAFQDLVATVTRAGVTVVVLVPPLPPPVRDAMNAQGDAFAYVAEVKRMLRALPVEVHDFQGGDEVVADACEYFDGYHGGDVVFQRILLAIGERHPASALRPYLDLDRLRETTRRFRGHVLTPFEPGRYRQPEVDFLHLGCAK
jgi:hypothetical protein